MYFKIILILFLPLFLYSQEKKSPKKLAYINHMSEDLTYKDSKDALQAWVKNIANNVTDDVELEIYTDNNLMINNYLKKDIKIMSFAPYYYMKNIDALRKKTKEFWHLKKDMNYDFHKKYLIVNKASNIDSLKDLKNKKIMINRMNKSAELFLEKKYLEVVKKSPKKILDNVEFVKTNSILLNIYFGKYEAAIINSNEYDTMIELNPGISKKVKILEESPRIFNFMSIAFSKENSDNDMKNFQLLLDEFTKSKNKDELFNLLKIRSINTNQNNLKDLDTYYKEYLKLKKKYDK